MIELQPASAISLATAALLAVGARAVDAGRVARGLVGADLAGVGTHGLAQLPRYLEAARSGELDVDGIPVVATEGPATAQVAGRWSFGHVAADVAVDLVISKVATYGVAAVGLIECHHIGRMGEFVEAAAARGVALLIFGGGQGAEIPAAVPFGGRTAVLHTNPIAIGAPSEGDPFVMDIATTVLSGSKVGQIAAAGGTLPPDAIVDAAGEPTTDPNDLAAGGAHLPFGRHKGYGFMLAAEVLGRFVTGADDVADTSRGGPWLRHAGYLFIGVAVDAFVAREVYDARVQTLFDTIRAVPPSRGSQRVLIPGDAEAMARANGSEALVYPDELITELRRIGRQEHDADA